MVSITQSQRWRQQPAGATQIDRSHPMARGLVFAVVGNMPCAQEMVSGNLSQPLGTSTAKTFNTGVGLYSPSNVGNGWYANYDPNIFRTIGNEFTIACEFVAESIGDVSILVSAPWADGTYNAPKVSFCLRRVTTTSTMMIEIGTTSATNINATFSNAMVSDGERATYVAVRSGATASLMRDNVPMTLAGSGLTSGANVGYNTASHVCLMNRSASSLGNGTGGGILWTYIWNRALTDQEQKNIYYNPYDIVLPVDRTRFYLSAVPDEFTGSSALASRIAIVSASGSVTNPATSGGEFSTEFSSEFGVQDTARSGSSALTDKISVVLSSGTRTIPIRAGSSSLVGIRPSVSSSGTQAIPARVGSSSLVGIRPSVSSSGSWTIPVRSGTSAATTPKVFEVASGSRTIPARTGTSGTVFPKTNTVAIGSRAVISISGSAVLSAVADKTSIIATRTLPLRLGTSLMSPTMETILASGTRTVPVRSGSANLTGLKPAVNASQMFLSIGASSLTIALDRVSGTGSRTSPSRTGTSALSPPKQIVVGTGSRAIFAISGSSVLRSPKATEVAFGPSADPRQAGILITNTCANLMLSAIGATLNSGMLRIYSGTEPSTATAELTDNILLAEMPFGATAFGSPIFVNSSCVITANLITGDSDANSDGIATFFRAIKSDGSTVVWQGAVGEELIITGSGANPYQIRKGSPVNVSGLTVSIRLF